MLDIFADRNGAPRGPKRKTTVQRAVRDDYSHQSIEHHAAAWIGRVELPLQSGAQDGEGVHQSMVRLNAKQLLHRPVEQRPIDNVLALGSFSKWCGEHRSLLV